MLLLLAPVHHSNAQSRLTLSNADTFKIANYKALPDKGYTIERVANDTSLHFSADSLRPQQSEYYWIKLVINNPYPNDEPYIFQPFKALNYTLYQYSPKHNRWEGTAAGLGAPSAFRKPWQMEASLSKQAENVLYVKISLRDIKQYNVALKPALIFTKRVAFYAEERFTSLFNLVCCIVLISFSVYNLYIYFQLKDKAYLYYVLVQIGALLYLVSVGQFLNPVFQASFYNIKAWPGGKLQYINLDGLVMHVGVTIIFCSFIEFTRSYLNTKQALPGYDKVLKIFSLGYILLEAVPVIITLSGWVYINNIPASNVYILLMVSTCIGIGIVAHRRGYKAAKYFLAANLLPLVFTVCTSVYILLYTFAGSLLPQMAILSQILTFAVALVARIKLVNEELKEKEIHAIQLANDIELTEIKGRLIEEENKNITLTMQLEKEKNEQLQQKLEANQRELVGNSLYIHQKNKLLAELRNQMQDIDTLLPDAKPETIRNIQSSLKEGQHLGEEWDKFKLHFEQVHPSFFNELQASHPNLTKYELRLYAYFHINLSTKEIAALLNIAPASVRQAKARLNKKMGKS
ncbi:7TM diverse intracellular signaling domain-containing protein [Mucilaginibacter pedocola]|uniref:7TM-DISM receptor extracellular domain-containing protein n=1 Tax=Mucilaginibacter pedocola TaxID=1792845 RepID=A0A1S9P6D1_9SPHI|nr:7TM diverse intracellular signaling domain-containing protein [Mucilaginibacter pedocola]OOQ56523.1 hypothetical protein BC343_18960 [Mucilaginibacter pedocola]